jgi:hypothetical protein
VGCFGWGFVVLLVIGGIVWGLDQLQPPPSTCDNEFGCQAIKTLRSDGVIDEFEFKEPESGDLATVEVNDDDNFLLHLDRSGYTIEYPSREDDLADAIDAKLERLAPK